MEICCLWIGNRVFSLAKENPRLCGWLLGFINLDMFAAIFPANFFTAIRRKEAIAANWIRRSETFHYFNMQIRCDHHLFTYHVRRSSFIDKPTFHISPMIYSVDETIEEHTRNMFLLWSNTTTTIPAKLTGFTILFENSYSMLYFFPQRYIDFRNDN